MVPRIRMRRSITMSDEEIHEIFANSEDGNLLFLMLLLFTGLQKNYDEESGDDDASSQE
jgi:hypothetical protein